MPDVDVVRAWVDGAGAAGWTALVLGLAVVLLLPVLALGGVGARRAGDGILAGARRGVRRGPARRSPRSASVGFWAAPRPPASPVARFGRVDELMARRGFVAVLTGRLLPMMPFVVLSYGAG